MVKNFLGKPVILIKQQLQKNELGEYEIVNQTETEILTFYNKRRVRLWQDKLGYRDEMVIDMLVSPKIEIANTDLFKIENEIWKIQELYPVQDINGNIVAQRLVLVRRE